MSRRPASDEPFDVVGIGIGPSNLSTAALLQPTGLRATFLDRKERFRWHPGLMLPDATIQVSYLKDLVSLVDPTSSYSFLNFLAKHRRLYQFINAELPRVSRREFELYYRWACALLPGLEFGQAVERVEFDGGHFVVTVAGGQFAAANLVLGSGQVPAVPEFARPSLGPTVFHASEFLLRSASFAGQRVAIVGGGQTSSEIVRHLLRDREELPAAIHWATRRSNLLPLDESPFTNELFTPKYNDYFFRLAPEVRASELGTQKLASDGISNAVLLEIYRRLYELTYLEGRERLVGLYPAVEMVGLERDGRSWSVALESTHTAERTAIEVDLVVLCTGWRSPRPAYLEPLAERLSTYGDEYRVRDDFSLEWDGPRDRRIYVHNAAKSQRGIADPNLSLTAWRSAKIVNSVSGREWYDTGASCVVSSWLEPEGVLVPAAPPQGAERRAAQEV